MDKKAVALSLVATFLIIVGDELVDRNRAPKPRRVVGMAAVFLILGMLAEIPATARLAKYFSVLVLIGVVYAVGPQLYVKLQHDLQGKTPIRPSRKVVKNRQSR